MAEQTMKNLRILVSFFYYRNTDMEVLLNKYFEDDYPDIFADSGAFSASSQGKSLDVNQYAEWIQRWEHLLTAYSNLDVIGDPKTTSIHQSILEKQGLSPIPVFHVGEDWSILEALIEQYPYIGLGGMVPHASKHKALMSWIIQCFKLAGNKSVFHGFGMTSWKIINSLPWYSVDSSSWNTGFSRGNVRCFDHRNNRFISFGLGDPQSCYRHANLIRSYNFDPEDFADRSKNDRVKIGAISALSFMKAEEYLRRRFGNIYIPGSGRNGLRLYGVGTSAVDADQAMSIRCITNGLKIYLQDSTNMDIGKGYQWTK